MSILFDSFMCRRGARPLFLCGGSHLDQTRSGTAMRGFRAFYAHENRVTTLLFHAHVRGAGWEREGGGRQSPHRQPAQML